MSHTIYTTEAFILATTLRKEASLGIDVFTREMGRVHAHAQGACLLGSKLRFHLSPLAFAQVDLVRGKEFWRVVGAQESSVLRGSSMFQNDKYNAMLRARMAGLLQHLVSGMERNAQLFDALVSGLSREISVQEKDEKAKDTEMILVLRTLNMFGYLAHDAHTALFTGDMHLWDEGVFEYARNNRRHLVLKINEGLRASAS